MTVSELRPLHGDRETRFIDGIWRRLTRVLRLSERGLCDVSRALTQNPTRSDQACGGQRSEALPEGAAPPRSARCRAAHAETNPTYGFCTSQKDEQGQGHRAARTWSRSRAPRGLRSGRGRRRRIKGSGGSDADASDAGDAGDADVDDRDQHRFFPIALTLSAVGSSGGVAGEDATNS